MRVVAPVSLCGLPLTRDRCAAATQQSTAAAAIRTAGSSRWPNSTTDSATVSSGCTSCTWLTSSPAGPAADRLAAARIVEDFGVARPLQETAVELLGSPAWPRHLIQLARALRGRRDHLLSALRRELPSLPPPVVPRGGLHLWLSLPSGTDDLDLSERARSHHLLVGAGRPYYVTEAPGPRLRVSFAAAPESQLSAGVRVLAQLLQSPAF